MSEYFYMDLCPMCVEKNQFGVRIGTQRSDFRGMCSKLSNIDERPYDRLGRAVQSATTRVLLFYARTTKSMHSFKTVMTKIYPAGEAFWLLVKAFSDPHCFKNTARNTFRL